MIAHSWLRLGKGSPSKLLGPCPCPAPARQAASAHAPAPSLRLACTCMGSSLPCLAKLQSSHRQPALPAHCLFSHCSIPQGKSKPDGAQGSPMFLRTRGCHLPAYVHSSSVPVPTIRMDRHPQQRHQRYNRYRSPETERQVLACPPLRISDYGDTHYGHSRRRSSSITRGETPCGGCDYNCELRPFNTDCNNTRHSAIASELMRLPKRVHSPATEFPLRLPRLIRTTVGTAPDRSLAGCEFSVPVPSLLPTNSYSSIRPVALPT